MLTGVWELDSKNKMKVADVISITFYCMYFVVALFLKNFVSFMSREDYPSVNVSAGDVVVSVVINTDTDIIDCDTCVGVKRRTHIH